MFIATVIASAHSSLILARLAADLTGIADDDPKRHNGSSA
jgi:hypothetical protein